MEWANSNYVGAQGRISEGVVGNIKLHFDKSE